MANTNCQTCGTCGIGGGSVPQPGDPSNNSILTATPAFGGIDVEWTYPGLNPHAVAHTLLIRGTSPHFENANRRFVVDGSFFYDKVEPYITYYYWIIFVPISGTELDPIGPAWAQARPLIADIIEDLTEQIDRGMLSQALKRELDEISIINANLLNEITSREDSNVTLAQALADVQAGIAQAHTFITTEIASRTSQDEALAEQLTLVASTLGDDYAAVITSMTTQINAVTGVVSAMWTAQVNVNDLIGGFGLSNDGRTVEAGFDVDRFWVGRTQANKRKPFIIEGGIVYIDEAAINRLTFSKLRDESGSFIVENGRVKANYLRVGTASIDDAAITNAKIGQQIQSNNYVAGVSGWSLNKNGVAEVNDIIIRRNTIRASGYLARTDRISGLERVFVSTAGKNGNYLGEIYQPFPAGSVIRGATFYINTGFTDYDAVANPYAPGFYGRLESASNGSVSPGTLSGNVYDLAFEVIAAPARTWSIVGSGTPGQRVVLAVTPLVTVLQPFTYIDINNYNWALFSQR